MSPKKNKILIPTDFTPVSDVAMNHALNLAKHNGAEVYLLHVVDKKEEVEAARAKLEKEQAKAKEMNGAVTTHRLVRVGSIYKDIGDAAAEINANLIVMGTHGMRGVLMFTGSRILRIITSSEVPFIVVQDRLIKETGYDSIVVPLDLHKETRQKLTIVADMARTFNSKVHLIVPKEDDEFLHKELANNIKFATHYLNERGIEHDATISEEDSNDFVRAVVKHALALDADLITIMNLSKGNIFGALGLPYEQEILTNKAHIPVMCMNPRETGTNSGWSFQ
ncbi:MAG: universal stress protein [Flavobacteriales bacterium]|nr:universal stress protein [Flavobacteriales bacterium]MBK6944319.1 universal stress protein [Flavobacteriales bacterium]MBK7242137.1 universal stress protein [Flavobacteriales bacterium]MBK7295184.1 universal stress protein [Flavobacteriales bacterium]MBK9533988.1 universal stress protein [Flavobacteriales bacterium]